MKRRDVLIGGAAVAAVSVLPASAAVIAPEVPKKTTAFIMPSWHFNDTHYRFQEDNCWTNVYQCLDYIDFQNKKFGRTLLGRPGGADLYAEWLRELPPKDGIPPHIQFGGAVVSGPSDPTFYDRWKRRTLEKLSRGELGPDMFNDTIMVCSGYKSGGVITIERWVDI